MLSRDAADHLVEALLPAAMRRVTLLLGRWGDDAISRVLGEVLVATLRSLPTAERTETVDHLYRVSTEVCLGHLGLGAPRDAGEGAISGEPPPNVVSMSSFIGGLPPVTARAAIFYFLDELTVLEVAQVMRRRRSFVRDVVRRLRAEPERLVAAEEIRARAGVPA